MISKKEKVNDEQYIELAWEVAQIGNASQTHEEELCWVLLERERKFHQPIIIAEISVDAFVAEVA